MSAWGDVYEGRGTAEVGCNTSLLCAIVLLCRGKLICLIAAMMIWTC